MNDKKILRYIEHNPGTTRDDLRHRCFGDEPSGHVFEKAMHEAKPYLLEHDGVFFVNHAHPAVEFILDKPVDTSQFTRHELAELVGRAWETAHERAKANIGVEMHNAALRGRDWTEVAKQKMQSIPPDPFTAGKEVLLLVTEMAGFIHSPIESMYSPEVPDAEKLESILAHQCAATARLHCYGQSISEQNGIPEKAQTPAKGKGRNVKPWAWQLTYRVTSWEFVFPKNGKNKELERQGTELGISGKHFKNVFHEINRSIPKKGDIADLEAAITLLADYPKAKKLAEDQLKMLASK